MTQRELKFRAWHIYNQEFIYAKIQDLIINGWRQCEATKPYNKMPCTQNGFVDDDFLSNMINESFYASVEWEQYTGLKDKHGVEIYEGDRVHCWGDYKDGEWGFDRIIKVELTSFKLATLEDCEYKEILGNVHENPELLEMVLKKIS